jgi:hypothetical protein
MEENLSNKLKISQTLLCLALQLTIFINFISIPFYHLWINAISITYKLLHALLKLIYWETPSNSIYIIQHKSSISRITKKVSERQWWRLFPNDTKFAENTSQVVPYILYHNIVEICVIVVTVVVPEVYICKNKHVKGLISNFLELNGRGGGRSQIQHKL